MRLGEVYLWETQVQNRIKRKYHIFICPPSDTHEKHCFLYINTMDWYKDYKILQADYPFLSYDSYVGCNAIVAYTDGQLKAFNPAPSLVGSLTKKHLKELRDAIIAAETMPQGDANRVCAALAAAI
jgi:hypothetical protein